MIRPPFGTLNVSDPRAYCGHCGNSGMVVVDHSEHDAQPAVMDDAGNLVQPARPGLGSVGAPCPMCQRGARIDANGTSLAYRKKEVGGPVVAVATGDGAGFWLRHDLERASWENGFTVRHSRRCMYASEGAAYSCGRPAVGQWCDYHAVDANRQTLGRRLPGVMPVTPIDEMEDAS